MDMNDGDGQGWSARTECSGERLLVLGDHDREVPALRRAVSRVASRHTREGGLPASRPKTETGQLVVRHFIIVG